MQLDTLPKQTILLTGGRAPVTLDLARQLTQVGHRVLVADSLQHQLCTCSRSVAKNFVVPAPREQPTAFITALQQIIQSEQVDWLIPTCEEVFYIAAGLEYLRPYCQVLVEPIATLNRLHNKWEFIQRLQAIGLTVPRTWLIRSPQDLQTVLKQATSKQLVLKPVYSRFATQVHFISTSIVKLPDIDLNPDRPWVVQEFIAGTHYCLYGIAHQGQLTAFAVYPTVFTAGAGSCICFESVTQPNLLTWMKTVVAAEQFTGQIAFDVIETPEGILYPLECNPRAISAIHLFAPTDRLDQALLNLSDRLIQPQDNQLAMITLAMLLYGLPQAIFSHRIRLWLRILLTARDVIFNVTDPFPALHLGLVLWQFVRLSIQQRQSLQQVSTQDIEWNGEAINVAL